MLAKAICPYSLVDSQRQEHPFSFADRRSWRHKIKQPRRANNMSLAAVTITFGAKCGNDKSHQRHIDGRRRLLRRTISDIVTAAVTAQVIPVPSPKGPSSCIFSVMRLVVDPGAGSGPASSFLLRRTLYLLIWAKLTPL